MGAASSSTVALSAAQDSEARNGLVSSSETRMVEEISMVATRESAGAPPAASDRVPLVTTSLEIALFPPISASCLSSRATTSALGVCGTASGLVESTCSRLTAARLILKPVEFGAVDSGDPKGVPVSGGGSEAGVWLSTEMSEEATDAAEARAGGDAHGSTPSSAGGELQVKPLASMASKCLSWAVRQASRMAPSGDGGSKGALGSAYAHARACRAVSRSSIVSGARVAALSNSICTLVACNSRRTGLARTSLAVAAVAPMASSSASLIEPFSLSPSGSSARSAK
mmetsp:Transcript_18895/g.53433  ORF Transcript_18895/g.53433 Transcript_18895/m.53433 type:complete len:285 (-) Transcript_18895:265-1119(-)